MQRQEESSYEIAEELLEHPDVSDVRVSKERITVAFAPREASVEKIPKGCFNYINDVISDTLFESEYDESGRNAERHSWGAGIHNLPMVPPAKQPAGYELQYYLVK